MLFQGLKWKYYTLFYLSYSSTFCSEEKQIWIFELVYWAFMCLCTEIKFMEYKSGHSYNAIQLPIYLFLNCPHYSLTNLSPLSLFSSFSFPVITTLCSVYEIINSESFPLAPFNNTSAILKFWVSSGHSMHQYLILFHDLIKFYYFNVAYLSSHSFWGTLKGFLSSGHCYELCLDVCTCFC